MSTMSIMSSNVSLFECPLCFDYVLPPVLQCLSGHLVCQSCCTKHYRCPICICPSGAVPNRFLDKFAEHIRFPCKYSDRGCMVTLKHTEKNEHDKVCEFRLYHFCPFPKKYCNWQGRFNQILPHLMTSHKNNITSQHKNFKFQVTDINQSGALYWVMVLACFNRHFVLLIQKKERLVGIHYLNVVIQIIGSQEEADKFQYKLNLNGRYKRLIWTASPLSITENKFTAITNHDCFVIDAPHEFEENGNLFLTVTVSPNNVAQEL